MTGPGHYREAERLLAVAGEGTDDQDNAVRVEAITHALLALTAATVDTAAGVHPAWIVAVWHG